MSLISFTGPSAPCVPADRCSLTALAPPCSVYTGSLPCSAGSQGDRANLWGSLSFHLISLEFSLIFFFPCCLKLFHPQDSLCPSLCRPGQHQLRLLILAIGYAVSGYHFPLHWDFGTNQFFTGCAVDIINAPYRVRTKLKA